MRAPLNGAPITRLASPPACEQADTQPPAVEDAELGLFLRLAVALGARRVAQAKDALACGTTLAADGYVFSHVPDGSAPIDPDGISHRFQRLARRLGV